MAEEKSERELAKEYKGKDSLKAFDINKNSNDKKD